MVNRLWPIKKPQEPVQFAVVDIESRSWVHHVVTGFYDGLEYKSFDHAKKFRDFIFCYKGPQNIFAHFGGKFDFMFLLESFLSDDRFKVKTIVPRGSMILFFEVFVLKGSRPIKLTFRDSAALLPFSLSSLTDNFNVKTKKGKWDHSKTKGASKKLIEYNRDDCLALYQVLESFYNWPLIKKSGGAFTMASQAMRIFRTYLRDDIWPLGNFASDFCRNAYLGGRTEIFKPICKNGPLYEYDVSSLYPYVMRENFMPSGKSALVFEWFPHKLGIYHVEVSMPEMKYPPLGIVRDNKYIFPIGNFEGYFTSVELVYAMSLGAKVKVLSGIVFDSKEKLFQNYIDDLYRIRKSSESGTVSNMLAKLLMNSSYGRFGMNLKRENIGFVLKDDVTEFATLKLESKKSIQLFKEPIELETFTHTGIAAFITSYARIHMHKLILQTGEKHLYYMDTDSLFTTKRLKTGDSLGQLKLENTWESAVFLLPKTYFAKGLSKNKIAMKGFDRQKIKHFTIEDFQTALEGDLRRFKVTNEPKFATFKTALSQKKLVTMTKQNDKQLRAIYDKREIFKNKSGDFDTSPIFLNEALAKQKPITKESKKWTKRPLPKHDLELVDELASRQSQSKRTPSE